MRIEKLERPLFTNAGINRKHAIAMFEVGMKPAEIAAAFPEAFKVSVENGHDRLGQRYDFEYSDGTKETNRMILEEARDEAICTWLDHLQGRK